MLNISQIEELSSRSKVKKSVVENFLGTLDGMSYQEAVANCEVDAKAYGWNHETSGAIREGLVLHYF
jgi:hypothetical protein